MVGGALGGKKQREKGGWGRPWVYASHPYKPEEAHMLLILGIILLVIAIAGGAIVHPILFALGIVALVLFFMHHSGSRAAI
jgi:hypothetical protein